MPLKLLPKNDSRTYELTMLVSAGLTSDETEKLRAQLLEVLKKHKAEVVREEDWGKRELAYTIKRAGTRFDEARYFHWGIAVLPSALSAIDAELRHTNAVIRFLLIQKDLEAPEPQDIDSPESKERSAR